MKPIRRHRTFEKHFRARVLPSKKLVLQFEERLSLFVQGIRDSPIKDHALTGTLQGKRAFSVTGDLRVIYEEFPDEYLSIDIGTHNQVYQ